MRTPSLLPVCGVQVRGNLPNALWRATEREDELSAVGRGFTIPIAADDVPDGIAGRIPQRPETEVAAGSCVCLTNCDAAAEPTDAINEPVLGEQLAECRTVVRLPVLLVVAQDAVQLTRESN